MTKNTFAQQAMNYKGPGQNYGYFLDDVPNYELGGKNQSVVIRICPDFERDEKGNVSDSTSWVPFRLNMPEENFPFSQWGAFIYVQNFMGHRFPNAKTRWAEVISPKSFDPEAHCVLSELVEAAKSNPTFSYLVSRWGGDKGTANSAPLSAPAQQLVLNTVRFGGVVASPCVELGLFSTGATSSLFHANKGLCHSMTDMPEEHLAANYLLQFSCRDLTAPNGPVVQCAKDMSTSFGQYTFTVARDARTKKVIYKDIEPLLDQRFDLTRPETWLRRMTDQEIVSEICKAFNAISPVDRETNELEFIRDVLGDRFEIPEPPPNKHALIAPEMGDTGQGAVQVSAGAPTSENLPFDTTGAATPTNTKAAVVDDLNLEPPAASTVSAPRSAPRAGKASSPVRGGTVKTAAPAEIVDDMPEDPGIANDPESELAADDTVPGGDPGDVDQYMRDLGLKA